MSQNLNFRVSPVFLANYKALHDPKVKIIANQGGTRSGKTYSIMQLLVLGGITNNGVTSVVSKTLPHIKRGVLRDFMEIMDHPSKGLGIYKENSFNKTELIYKFNKNTFIEMFSADNSEKLRGPGRDYLFINEANLLTLEEYRQLIYRTRKKIIIDYNPVDEYSWIYDHVLTREDCRFIQSSYLDNYDFLEKTQIEEIERLRETDKYQWEIFGLGNVAKATNLIFNNFVIGDQPFVSPDETIYGIDFGFNNPTAVVEIQNKEKTLFIKEKVYDTELTTPQLIDRLKEAIPNKSNYIYADSAEPDRIKEIYDAGFNVWPADKSVKSGIDYVKRFDLVISPDSTSVIKEVKSYKWKQDKNEHVLDEPVKFNDHAADAIRYAVFTHGTKYWNFASYSFPNVHLKSTKKQSKYSEFL